MVSRSQIRTAKQIIVVQHVIEIVDLASVLVSVHSGIDLEVSFVKITVHRLKHLRHRKIGLGMPHIGSRIDENDFAVFLNEMITAPHITVQK